MSHPESVVLLSGGLDSAVLAAHEARTYVVHPVYVAAGLAWEEGEQRIIEALLAGPPFDRHDGRIHPLVRLDFTIRDVYPPTHWALTGKPPAYDTPDQDVYLHGRNIALLSKAAIYAASRNIGRLAVAPLAGNPFPDATAAFFTAFSEALSIGLAVPMEVRAPFSDLHKEDVVKMGVELGVPLEKTLSCMDPVGTTHCGLCSKCRERRDAFQEAGLNDPTTYANLSPR